MAAALRLEPTAALPENSAELRDMLVFGRGFVKDRTAAQARLKTASSPLLVRLFAQPLAQIARQVAKVDGELEAIARADPNLPARLDILISIPGISTVSAMDMPELGQMSRKQTGALAGLAPIPASRDDGGATTAFSAIDPPFADPCSCLPRARSSTTVQQREVRPARRRRQAAQGSPDSD